MKFWSEHASYPFKSHDLWFVTGNPLGQVRAGHGRQGPRKQSESRGSLARRCKGAVVARVRHPAFALARQGDFFDGKVFDPEQSERLPQESVH